MRNVNQLFIMQEPSGSLKTSIINTIRKEQTKRAIYKIALNFVVSLASISIAVVFIINIIKDAYQSGLSEYLSLIFSDGATLVTYWQTYVLSIVESLPIIQITLVFASIWVFVWSIDTALTSYKNSKSFFYKIS